MPWNQKRVVARTTPILHRYHTTIPISLTHPNDSSPFIIFKGIISLVKLNLYGCNNGASIKWTHWWLGGDSSGMTHPPINKKRVEERGEVYESSTQLVYTVWSLEWITWTFFFSSHEIHGQNNDRLLFVISSLDHVMSNIHTHAISVIHSAEVKFSAKSETDELNNSSLTNEKSRNSFCWFVVSLSFIWLFMVFKLKFYWKCFELVLTKMR